MKKITSFLLSIALVLLAFSSCGAMVAEKGDVTVVIEVADGEYEVYKTYLENVENKKNGALGVLESLRDREENPLHLVYSDSGYGAFITEIGSIKQNEAVGEYVVSYTSVETDSYAGAPTREYEGMTLFSSGVGVSSMTVNEGTVILFRITVYK